MGKLRPGPYQLIPLTKLLLNGRNGVLVCDGVGVGKTISAGYALAYLTAALGRSGLVVCPPSLQEKWKLELIGKFGLSVVPIRSPEELSQTHERWAAAEENDTVIVMPSSILARSEVPPFSGPVVVDEIHNYRNPQTKAWGALREVVAESPYRIGLTATPINNQLGDLAAELSLVLDLEIHEAEALLSELWRKEFRETLYPLMTRFTKEQLGIHFARRKIMDIHVEYPVSYLNDVRNAVKQLRLRPDSESMYRDELTYYRLAASSPAAFEKSTGMVTTRPETKARHLQRILGQHLAETVIVCCEFTETAKEIGRLVDGRTAYVLTGEMPVFEREDTLQQFEHSGNGVLVMTSVGTEGLDMQFCSVLVNFDLNWNPMVLEQRIGRIDRIGQRKSEIMIHNLIVAGSIDERILQTLGRKLGLVSGTVLEPSSILGGDDPNVGTIFDATSVAQSAREAESLARALELSQQIIPDDYAIQSSVDTSFCDPSRLRTARLGATVPWFTDSPQASAWSAQLKARSERLSQAIEYYQ